ncbi:MAG TPA: SBBP repeat-containing protein, partial [Verrucomicrobiae bacterium]|nr:SBBP repeat-containing protein [Verrucomicrobiae bacterium]
GNSNEIAYAVALNTNDDAYVVGSSSSTNFYVTTTTSNSPVKLSRFATNVFVTVIATNGPVTLNTTNGPVTLTNSPAIKYSTVFGGSGIDVGLGVAIDQAGNSFVIGSATSTNFPTTNTLGGLRAVNAGGSDVFESALNSNLTSFLYSAYLGGTTNDYGYSIAVDPADNAYIVGGTSSTNFPTESSFGAPTYNSAYQIKYGGGTNDAFVAKILMQRYPTLGETLSGTNVVLSWPAFQPEFYLESNTNLAESSNWTAVGQSPAIINGAHTVTLPATNDARFFRLQEQ